MQALENHDKDVADDVDEEELGIEEGDLELECGRAWTMKDPTEAIVIRTEVQALISKEEEKSTTRNNVPVLTQLVVNKLLDAL